MRPFKINSTNAIHDFLHEVYCRSGKIFDPAKDLKTLQNKNGTLVFSKEEGEYLDNVMTECFIYCVHNNLNIYRIVHGVGLQLSRTRAVA